MTTESCYNGPHGCLKGQFLLAMPGLRDGFFANSLVYVIEHNADGVLAVVVNHPSSILFADVLDQIGIHQCLPQAAAQVLHIGGPLQVQHGLVLHTPDRQWAGTQQLDDDLCLSTSSEVLHALAAGEGPEHSLILLGHAGWAAGQLEQELDDSTWLSLPADSSILFDCPPEQRAREAAGRQGIPLDRLAPQAGHA